MTNSDRTDPYYRAHRLLTLLGRLESDWGWDLGRAAKYNDEKGDILRARSKEKAYRAVLRRCRIAKIFAKLSEGR